MNKHFGYNITILFLLVFFINVANSFGQKTEPFGFIKVDSQNGRYFSDEKNNLWIPIEINMPVFASGHGNTSDLQYLEKLIAVFAANGGNSVRLFLGEYIFDCQDGAFGYVDENKLKSLDEVVALASRYHVKIKFCIETVKSLPLTANSKVGRQALLKNNGGKLSSFEDYVNTPEGRSLYYQRAKLYISRYADNSTVYAWELWNEVNTITAGDWYSFTQYMLPKLKALAPHQLITTSLGSMGNEAAEGDYRKYSSIKSNEIFLIHRYLDPGAAFSLCHGNLDLNLSDAVSFAYSTTNNIPVFINETGAVKPHHTGDSPLLAQDKSGILLDDVLYAPFFTGAAGPGSIWQLGGYVGRNGLWNHYKFFADFISQINPVTQHLLHQVIAKASFNEYILKNDRVVYMWLRSKTGYNLLSKSSNIEIQIPLSISGSKKASVKIIDPITGKVENTGTIDKQIYEINNFQYEKLVVITLLS